MLVGTAEADITPEVGCELSGFAARSQPSTGILDLLFARCLYLERDGERIVWVHCDLIGFERELAQSIRAQIGSSLNLEPSRVVLSATHTHSGPSTIHLLEAGRYDDVYANSLPPLLVRLALEASRKPETLRLRTTSERLTLACGRRAKNRPPETLCRSVRFERADGSCPAILANYPMHPVALGSANRMISGDVHGRASHLIGTGTTLFMTNGACGDLNPPAEGLEVLAVDELARAMLASVLSSSRRDGGHDLRIRSKILSLDFEPLVEHEIMEVARRALRDEWANAQWPDRLEPAVERWKDNRLRELCDGSQPRGIEVELQAVRLGTSTWLTANAELFSQAVDDLRHGAEAPVVVCYANGLAGYVPPRAAYGEGGYELELAPLFYDRLPFRRGAYEKLIDAAAAEVRF